MFVAVGDIRPLGKDGVWLLLGGCQWKCAYCYEHAILDKAKCKTVNIQELAAALLQSKPKLVKIDGGEPCEQAKELEAICSFLKESGVSVQLQTNGGFPGVVGDLLTRRLVDWMSIDVKAPLNNLELYRKMTNNKGDPQRVRESVDIAKDQAEYFEVVYPVVPGVNDKALHVKAVASDVSYCNQFTLRGFDHRRGAQDKTWLRFPQAEMKALRELAKAARDAFYNVDTIKIESVFGVEEL
jgi:pyruvate formate lyase activating enzyme